MFAVVAVCGTLHAQDRGNHHRYGHRHSWRSDSRRPGHRDPPRDQYPLHCGHQRRRRVYPSRTCPSANTTSPWPSRASSPPPSTASRSTPAAPSAWTPGSRSANLHQSVEVSADSFLLQTDDAKMQNEISDRMIEGLPTVVSGDSPQSLRPRRYHRDRESGTPTRPSRSEAVRPAAGACNWTEPRRHQSR